MQTERYFPSAIFAMFGAALATVVLVACQHSQPPAPAPSTRDELKVGSTEKVFVVFEGPWAIVPDPKDANSVLAMAPKTKSHRQLAVAPANTALEAGVYDLQVPAHGAAAATTATLDPSFFRATID